MRANAPSNANMQVLTDSLCSVQITLMSSWALVGDVWFLEPQQRQEGESAIAFAGRVQRLIAERAKLEIVPWDGYLKYYNLEKKV